MKQANQFEGGAKNDFSMSSGRALKIFWMVCMALAVSGLIVMTFVKEFSFAQDFSKSYLLVAVLGVMAFIAEYVDSSIGMGYGTTLTPVLLIMGFTPLQIVPAILLSEFISGTLAGGLHHKVGNVNLKRGTRANKIMIVLALCSIIGTVIAVLLALSLPKHIVKLYIGLMILAIGLFILVGQRLMSKFSWGKVIGLGTVAAFNKGISGGGYGPLVTGGQVMVGIPGKNAVGITSLAEGLVCLVGLILYISLKGGLYWRLSITLTVGALLSVPAAVWTVKVLPESMLKKSIGFATLFLGILTLIKVMI